MKDVSKINFNVSYDYLKYKIFWNEELWYIKHVMDTTQHTRFILDAHYKNMAYVRSCQKVNI